MVSPGTIKFRKIVKRKVVHQDGAKEVSEN